MDISVTSQYISLMLYHVLCMAQFGHKNGQQVAIFAPE